ncbi:uncharacterized protein MP3633_3074 [Marinomonas primoryensis]|uniref:Uncharacterized protein n=1 Tax=Marinomonas primoryensis TaxID=178399 RepID=A0A859D4B6_9GAMM|nr:uncharacterized protein MP3633_3074 [Marinomonas primoryensis]
MATLSILSEFIIFLLSIVFPLDHKACFQIFRLEYYSKKGHILQTL